MDSDRRISRTELRCFGEISKYYLLYSCGRFIDAMRY